MILAAFDWNGLALAIVAGVFSILNTVALAGFYWYVRPPSGGRLGRIMEEAHQNSSATLAAVTGLQEDTNGTTTHPPAYKPPSVTPTEDVG